MKNGWVKYFLDGTKEEGWDDLVKARLASWTNGRHEGIGSVEMHHDDRIITINGPGRFWQQDTFEAKVLVNGGELVERKILRQITSNDIIICLHGGMGGSSTVTVAGYELVNLPCPHRLKVKPSWIGKWISLKMDIKNRSTIWNIEELLV